MINNERINEILEKTGVLLQGHFLLTSGKHSNRYMQCARIFQYPEYTAEVSRDLADKFMDFEVDVVVGPAVGGIILAYEVAKQLEVKALFAERENGAMALRRGFEISKGSRVLIVEDVITTGGSVKEVIELVRSIGADVVGVGCVVDRSAGRALFDVPYKSVVKVEIEAYEPKDCPLCKAGSTPYKPGSRNVK